MNCFQLYSIDCNVKEFPESLHNDITFSTIAS